MKTLQQTIKHIGKQSGNVYWHDYMGGSMLPRGMDKDAISRTLAYIYGRSAKEIYTKLAAEQEKEFERLRKKQVASYKRWEKKQRTAEAK